jgi:superfamily II DNA or RNA helicase
MGIDDIVDEIDHQSPGKRFRQEWLNDLPPGQWPSYIDENARLVADGISIGETDLTKADFAPETGEFYFQGLAESADIDPEETSLPLGKYSPREVGLVAWVFNRLRKEIRDSDYTEFENPSRAIEAVINKSLVESIEEGEIDTRDLETIRLPESASVSTLVSEVFCRPRNEAYIDLLLDNVKDNRRSTSSLLEHLEAPRMVTPLWQHQRDALDSWLAHDCRGYVDMATATGKTVLGLAAVAHHFGALHPDDRGLTNERLRPDTNGRETVIVIAHRDLVLDQWKREFDTHLNIPEQSTTDEGEHTAAFEWGDVHFWTPKRLQERGVPDAELVVLDETHHYLGSSGFGSILDEVDGHIIALSGSLDNANARSLERRDIPELLEFTLQDGQEAGIIPQCDWDIYLTPYENQSQLAEVTAECRAGIEAYADGVAVSDTIDGVEDAVDTSFENLSEVRSLGQSTVGRELKERDPEFRAFVSAVRARQMTQYNLSPTLSTVVHLTLDHIDQHKCVILLETNEEIHRVTDALESGLGDAFDSLVTVMDDEADLSDIEEFDREQHYGAIVGVARTLGEGIDIETADVCINRGRGRLSRSLVQRMGRILRNPDGDKHARFFHVTGVPTQEEALLPKEDGLMLLETASQLLTWGEGFNARPVFSLDPETAMRERDLVELERAGVGAVNEWTPDHYDWPDDEAARDHLESLCSLVDDHDESALLAIERPERDTDDFDEIEDRETDARRREEDIRFVAADNSGIEVAKWLATIAAAAADDDLEEFIEECVRAYVRETITFPPADAEPDAEATRAVTINPALDAVLSAYAGPEARRVAVHAAIATALEDDVPDFADRADLDLSVSELEFRIEAISKEGS